MGAEVNNFVVAAVLHSSDAILEAALKSFPSFRATNSSGNRGNEPRSSSRSNGSAHSLRSIPSGVSTFENDRARSDRRG